MDEISKVEVVPFSVTEKHFCICIQTKSELYHFSLDLGDELREKLEIDKSDLAVQQESWVNSISALIKVETFSMFNKKQIKKHY